MAERDIKNENRPGAADKSAPQGDLWRRLDDEAEMLRKRTTPSYMKQRIMDALPEEPPAPWYRRMFRKK